jgi:dipeptidyl aminopeptidase/acylaminoacyl peptidase
MKLRLMVAAAVLFLVPLHGEKLEKWSVDDVVRAEGIGAFEISPDGKWMVWVKSSADAAEDKRISHLMLTSLTEKREIQLTRGKPDCSNPRWSPNGEHLAFLTSRPIPKAKDGDANASEPKPQLWLIHPFGGEAWHLTSEERPVATFRWADDNTIIFAAQESPTLYEQSAKLKKDGSRVVDDELHEPPVRLFKVGLKEKKVVRLTDNTDRIQLLEVSPNGKWAVTVNGRSLSYTYDQRVRPVTFLHNLASGESRQLFSEGKTLPRAVRWAADGKGFYLTRPHTSDPVYLFASITLLHYFDLESETLKEIPLGWENGLTSAVEVVPGGFVALLANGARPQLARYRRSGGVGQYQREDLSGDHQGHIGGFAAEKEGKVLVYVYSTGATPPQLFRANLDSAQLSAPRQLTHINEAFTRRPKGKSEVVRWKGARDEEVEGVLYYPHEYRPGHKYPLVLMIHGGPAGVDYDMWEESWATPQNLMNQRGAFVLKPNYHGSSDYGLKWVESIGGGNYYDLEVPDIEKGVDYLIERGFVDPEKLGTMGWSNGSILTIALTVTTTRYKVASAGAGDVDWTSDWGNCAFGAAFDNYYFGASPLDNPQLYLEKSPFFRLKDVRTPTIIFFGTEDTSVPTQQGWMHYRALQQLGQTDVRFVLFPGEAHSLRKLSHQRRKLEEELRWFDRYLFEACEEQNEAVKPSSPLHTLLQVLKAKRHENRFGLLHNGILVPETVEQEGLKIGRFEVTQAQFAAFDPSYQVPAGKENVPAHGIEAERADAYCKWLSEKTGRTFRLGKEAEMEALYGPAKGSQNNLDYWAGYKVNPDDAARLATELKQLGPDLLLKPVGSFPVGEDEQLFDLGGNVSEWVIGKDGGFVALGSSADTPADSKLRNRRPDASFVGFRVVERD